jgi:hypothetical protein
MRSVKAITNLDVAGVQTQEACRKLPILRLLNPARWKGWKARLLDYRPRGDSTKDCILGDSTVAFQAARPEHLAAEERRVLLALARQTIRDALTTGARPEIGTFHQALFEPRGCFVTLTSRGQLRGCMGSIQPLEPLWAAIAENARNAALHDPRFEPVQRDELDSLDIEISVLTPPQPVQFASPDDLLSKLRPGTDGVVLQVRGRSVTYLPQVWAQLPDKLQFMGSLSEKAGWEVSAWRSPGTLVATYQVESFTEDK